MGLPSLKLPRWDFCTGCLTVLARAPMTQNTNWQLRRTIEPEDKPDPRRMAEGQVRGFLFAATLSALAGAETHPRAHRTCRSCSDQRRPESRD